MKIKEIKVWSVDLGNTKPYTIAFKTIDEVKNAFVEIILENGLTGIGAGNPSEYVVGETLDQCLEVLKPKNLQFLIGRDIREFNQLLFDLWKKFPDNPSARAALDIALHDVLTDQMSAVPNPDEPLKESDTLLVAGKDEDLVRVAQVK